MKTDHKKVGLTIAGRLLIAGMMVLACATYAQEQLAGIGAQVAIYHHALTVIHVLPDTPASKAGLTSGLIIQKIDDVATAGKNAQDCAAMIRGVVGTTVKLELVDTDHSKTNTVELTRAEIKR
jgi:carboxyl-terminal processing protease